MKSKKLVSLLLAALMTVSVGIQPAFAAGNDAGDPWDSDAQWPQLTRAASEMKPEDPKFTHKEWTGTTYTGLDGQQENAWDVVGINREPAATSTVPYESVDKAVTGAVDYAKDQSAYVQMLSGSGEKDWQLVVVSNPEKGQKYLDDGFMNPDYEVKAEDGWYDVEVPRSWTRYEDCGDWDYSIYTNTQMPWQEGDNASVPQAPTNYNPVGFYRKEFTVNPSMLQENGRVLISFQGVESAYYVYVNGHEVGYSEDSYRPHEFDITDYLNPQGEVNTLAVEVHKFCDGTWMEDQDMIYDGGIFRDVYLYSTPLVHISDYRVITDLDETYTNADLQLSPVVTNYAAQDVSNFAIDVQLFDAEGNDVFADDPMHIDLGAIAAGESATADVSKLVQSPKLWSAEDPNLYTLVLNLYDKTSGKLFESVSQQLGFREIEFTRTEVDENYNRITTEYEPITINGQPLLFRGTNRHDTDPFGGKYVPKEVYEEDVKVMKAWNLNAVRTSHYSNDEYLYYLCDKYGLYMMGETNAECHAIMGQNDNINNYLDTILFDRQNTSYQTLKNQTAVVAWSIGNEMSYDRHGGDDIFPRAVWFFKDRDLTRPVHAEGLNQDCGTDMGSNMYPAVGTVQGYAGEGKMPYVMCEYDHAMGNAVGNIKEYWDAVRSSDNMLGGFIWDWVDQSRYIDLDSLPSQSNITERSNNAAVATMTGPTTVNDADDASLTGKSYSGYAVISGEANDVYNEVLSGEDANFTFEVMVKPDSTAMNSVFLAKGDTQVALKTRSSGAPGVEFFVYNGGWSSASFDLPSDWVGNWHQIAGTYDGSALRVYYDGNLMATTNGRFDIRTNSYDLGVGIDLEHNRTVDGEISIARIYNKALTAEELQAQNSQAPAIGATDDSVVLWLDYSEPITELESQYWDYYAEDYAQQNLYNEEMDGKFFGYGGDFGDSNNSGNFCVNGLVSPDRDPQPELYEVKYQYQSIWVTATENALVNRKVNIYNENNFTNVNDYEVQWKLLQDGEIIDEGTLTDEEANVAPKETKTVTIPYTMPAENERPAGAEYYLNIDFLLKEDTLWADAGHEVAHEQLAIPASVPAVAPVISDKAVTVDTESDADYVLVEGDGFSFKLNKTTGAMSNYVFQGEEIIEEGPAPDFWRAANDNDKNMDSTWKNANKNITLDEDGLTVSTAEDGRTVITTELTLNNAKGAKETVVYTIDGSGAVTVNFTLDATDTSMGQIMKVGSTMTLPAGYENITWYGNGPSEGYTDRCSYATVGVFDTTVTDSFYPFLRPQTSGNHNGVKWMALTGEEKPYGVLVAGKQDLEASALHFTMDELDAANHPYELTAPNEETYFHVDLISRGIGNASCGPDNLDQYKVPNNQAYTYEYTIIPYETASGDPMELSKPWRTLESFDQDAFDQQQAQAVEEAIDSIFVYSYDQLDEVEAVMDLYEGLTDAQKALVSNYSDLESALEEVLALRGKAPYVKDQSNNAMDPVIPGTATLIQDDTFGAAMTGYMPVPNDKGTDGGDLFKEVFAGKNPFTVEVWVKPSSNQRDYDMFLGKGDSCMGFRIRTSTIDFFIKANDGKWYTYEYEYNRDEVINKWNHIAGIYDGSNLYLYLNGEIVAQAADSSTGGVASNDTDFYIGYDSETGRSNSNQFAKVRVYNKALSADELNGQDAYDKAEAEAPAITPDNENVILWLDFATLGYNDVPVVDEDGVTLSPKNAEIVLGTDQEYTIVKAAPTATAKAGSARAAATMEDLQALLEQANGIDTSIYTESSVAILNAAINVANVVVATPGAAEAIIDSAYNMLKAAIEGLVWDDTYEVTSADWSIVDSFGREIEGASITPNPEDAGKATVSVGENVPVGTRIRVMATNINGNENLSAKTYATVVPVPEKTPYEKLQELYLEATKIHDAGQGEYLDTAWEAFESAYAAAGAALDNESATDAELLNALDTLQAAIDGLTVEEPSEHTLRVEYDSNVTLLVNGEKPPFADLLGSYTAEVMAGDEVTLTFATRLDGREFAAASVLVNGEETPVDIEALDSTKEFDYVLTMPNTETTVQLVSTVVSKLALREAIANAETAMAGEEYATMIPSAKRNFDAAYAAAVAVEADKTALQDEIDEAWKNMLDAMFYLSFTAGDREGLAALLDLLPDLNEEDFTPNSWEAYEKAVTDAEALVDDEDALETEVEPAKQALQDAIAGLTFRADTSSLETLIAKAEEILADLDSYESSEEVKNAFIDALDAAKAMMENANATQKEVNACADDLTVAMANLRKTPDKDALEALIAQGEQADANDYTAVDYAALKAAIQTAKAVVAKADASSEEIVSAYNTLQARINATTEVEEPTKPDAGNSHKTSGSSSSKNNSNVYGSAGTAVVNQAVTAAQNVLAQASVYSDTTVSFSLKRGSAYCFKMTVVNGNGVAPSFTVGNGSVLKTQFVAQIGNDYYYRVYAVGTPGQSTGVYTTLPGQNAQQHCSVTIA